MSFMDKILEKVKLVDDDYDDEFDDYEIEDEEYEEKRGFFGFGKSKKAKDDIIDEKETKGTITPMRGGNSPRSMKVCVIKPTSYDDVKEISDTLLSNCTIILNMEGIDLALAQRIIDFMLGSCYAIDGNFQKISNYIFIISPKAVGISGDLLGMVNEFETQALASGGGFASF